MIEETSVVADGYWKSPSTWRPFVFMYATTPSATPTLNASSACVTTAVLTPVCFASSASMIGYMY